MAGARGTPSRATEPRALTAGRPGLGEEAANSVTRPAGVVFYAWRSLPYAHAIWHGFVLAGSALHFAAVLLYVARA